MNKIFSILLVLVVLLSTLNFTIAGHFCSGELARVKVGFDNAMPSCGMENHELPGDLTISPLCCSNSSSVLSLDNFKVSGPLEIQKITLKLIQVLLPVLQIHDLNLFNFVSFADEGLHHPFKSLPGRLAFICVFRK